MQRNTNLPPVVGFEGVFLKFLDIKLMRSVQRTGPNPLNFDVKCKRDHNWKLKYVIFYSINFKKLVKFMIIQLEGQTSIFFNALGVPQLPHLHHQIHF